MAETPLGKQIIGFIEACEQAAIAIKSIKDQAMQLKDILEKKEEPHEQEPGASTT